MILIPAGWLGTEKNTFDDDTLRRLRAGLALWRQEKRHTVLLTGGVFRSKRVQTRPASELMRDWLLENGVPQGKILIENTSLDTYGNVSGAIEVLARHRYTRPNAQIVVVSQFQHVVRFWLTFLLAHKTLVRCVPLWYVNSLKSFFVEWLFIAYHLVDWRGTLPLAVNNRKERAKRLV